MTTSFFLTRDEFTAFRTAYLNLAHLRNLAPSDIVVYNIVRDLPLDRGFTPITNSVKLSNGATPTLALTTAIAHLKFQLRRYPVDFRQRYAHTLTDEHIAHIVSKL